MSLENFKKEIIVIGFLAWKNGINIDMEKIVARNLRVEAFRDSTSLLQMKNTKKK